MQCDLRLIPSCYSNISHIEIQLFIESSHPYEWSRHATLRYVTAYHRRSAIVAYEVSKVRISNERCTFVVIQSMKLDLDLIIDCCRDRRKARDHRASRIDRKDRSFVLDLDIDSIGFRFELDIGQEEFH